MSPKKPLSPVARAALEHVKRQVAGERAGQLMAAFDRKLVEVKAKIVAAGVPGQVAAGFVQSRAMRWVLREWMDLGKTDAEIEELLAAKLDQVRQEHDAELEAQGRPRSRLILPPGVGH